MGGKKGLRKNSPVSEVSPRLGPSREPLVRVSSPLVTYGLQAILQGPQIFGYTVSEGHEGVS